MPDESPIKPITFAGEFLHSLDNKNRVTIPAAWRKPGAEPTDEFFVVPEITNKFLMAMPPDEFTGVRAEVHSNPTVSPAQARIFLRHFYGKARSCVLDRQGRLVLPDEHCKDVGLKAEVMLNGVHGRFEIWNPERYAQNAEAGSQTYKDVGELIGIW